MTETMKKFVGKYILEKNENMEEFLGANGAPWIARKMAVKTTPTLEMRHVTDPNGDDVIEAKTHSLGFSNEVRINCAKDFEETVPNGIIMIVTPSWEGEKLVLNYRPKIEGTAKRQRMTRELVEDKFIMTMEIDDIIAKRVFKKLS